MDGTESESNFNFVIFNTAKVWSQSCLDFDEERTKWRFWKYSKITSHGVSSNTHDDLNIMRFAGDGDK
jgi:hypothetical protein